MKQTIHTTKNIIIKRNSLSQRAFGLIETIIAISIFSIIAVTGATTVIHTFSINRLGSEETNASFYAQEGIEAVRSIKNQGWSDQFLTPAANNSCSITCGVTSEGGSWAFKTGTDSKDGYIRSILMEDVMRDVSGNIVTSGGIDDPDTKKITSVVNWNFTPTRANEVIFSSYLSNWSRQISTPTPTPSNTPTPILTPTPGGPTLTPTPTPAPSTCAQYCIGAGYSSGTCRQNAVQCSNFGETHVAGGDFLCTGGPSADTCCCL